MLLLRGQAEEIAPRLAREGITLLPYFHGSFRKGYGSNPGMIRRTKQASPAGLRRAAPCSMFVPSLGAGDEGGMGRRNADRIPRVGFLREGPPGSIRMATCEKCGYEAPLPVEAIIKRHGEAHPLEWALYGLRCSSCGSAGVHIRYNSPLYGTLP